MDRPEDEGGQANAAQKDSLAVWAVRITVECMKLKLIKFLCALGVFASIPGCMVTMHGNGMTGMVWFGVFWLGLAGFIVCRFFE